MKKYLSSDISCFVNAMLVVLILLASSCSSNWKYEYLKNEAPRNIDAKGLNTQADNSEIKEIEIKDEEEDTTKFVDKDYKGYNKNARLELTRDSEGNISEASDSLDEIRVFASKLVYTPVDTSGRLIMTLLAEIPKDIISSDWQIRIHPKLYVRQNKIISDPIDIDDFFITGSGYRDKQLRGYEKYSNYLSKIMTDGSSYNNSINVDRVLNENIPNYVNKYQLEYFIMRNFPEIYSLKNDTSYISDEKFSAILGVDKDEVIRHYYNNSESERIAKLSKNKRKNYKEWVYNPIVEDKIEGDHLVLRDTLDEFDKDYHNILKKIKDDDTLRNRYFSYIEKVKKDSTADYPNNLSSDYVLYLDTLETPTDDASNVENTNKKDKRKEEQKNNLFGKFKTNIKVPSIGSTYFKLDKQTLIYGKDTTKIYMQFSYSTTINAYQFPNIDKAFIGLSGDVYVDTTLIHSFVMPDKLEYPVVSVATLADTTEIVYDSIPIPRKANHGANYSIEFAKNNAVLNPKFGNNEQIIADIKASLDALMKNAEFDLDSIFVSATASPEGAITVNQRFSGQRSDAVSKYFKNYIDANKWKYQSGVDSSRREILESIESIQSSDLLTDKEKEEFISDEKKKLELIKIPEIEFKVHPIAENWDDLWKLVTDDSVMTPKEKNQYYNTVEHNHNLDVRENTMKKHSYYDYMSKELYPKIRVVKFEFYMHRKGQELDTIWKLVPSEKYLEGVKALRNFDFITAENILKQYPSYNTAILYIVRKKPLQAINMLEDPKLRIDFEFFKTKRDSLTQMYISLDSSMTQMKDTLLSRINVVKEKMDRAAKIEFLKAKAYFMRNKRDEKALQSYLFLLRVDKLNGLYSKAMTGEELKGGAIFGSNEYFEFSAKTDEFLSALPLVKDFINPIKDYKEKLISELWNEKKKYFTAKEKEEYNNMREAYMYDEVTQELRTEEELERVIMNEWQ